MRFLRECKEVKKYFSLCGNLWQSGDELMIITSRNIDYTKGSPPNFASHIKRIN